MTTTTTRTPAPSAVASRSGPRPCTRRASPDHQHREHEQLQAYGGDEQHREAAPTSSSSRCPATRAERGGCARDDEACLTRRLTATGQGDGSGRWAACAGSVSSRRAPGRVPRRRSRCGRPPQHREAGPPRRSSPGQRRPGRARLPHAAPGSAPSPRSCARSPDQVTHCTRLVTQISNRAARTAEAVGARTHHSPADRPRPGPPPTPRGHVMDTTDRPVKHETTSRTRRPPPLRCSLPPPSWPACCRAVRRRRCRRPPDGGITAAAPGAALRTWTAADERPPVVDLASATRTALTHDLITACRHVQEVPGADARRRPRLRVFAYMNAAYARAARAPPSPTTGTPATRPAQDRVARLRQLPMDVRSRGLAREPGRAPVPPDQGLRLRRLHARHARRGPLDRPTAPASRSTGHRRDAAHGRHLAARHRRGRRAVAAGTGKPVSATAPPTASRYRETEVRPACSNGVAPRAHHRDLDAHLDRRGDRLPEPAQVEGLRRRARRRRRPRRDALTMVKIWAAGTLAKKERWHQSRWPRSCSGPTARPCSRPRTRRPRTNTKANPWWSTPVGTRPPRTRPAARSTAGPTPTASPS